MRTDPPPLLPHGPRASSSRTPLDFTGNMTELTGLLRAQGVR
jgi:hypothetical protein